MRGTIGFLTGSVASLALLGLVSSMGELPAGIAPPVPPLVQAPDVAEAPSETVAETVAENVPENVAEAASENVPENEPENVAEAPLDAPSDTVDEVVDVAQSSSRSTPVGSVSIVAPVAPDVPQGGSLPVAQDQDLADPVSPLVVAADPVTPRADTDPLDLPDVGGVDDALQTPVTPQSPKLVTGQADPVLPNPQSPPPQTPLTEADLTIQTDPVPPVIVTEPDSEGSAQTVAAEEELFVIDPAAPDPVLEDPPVVEDVAPDIAPVAIDGLPQTNDEADDTVLAQSEVVVGQTVPDLGDGSGDDAAPLVQLGGENSLLNRDAGVTIRRPFEATQDGAEAGLADGAGDDAPQDAPETNALTDFAAAAIDTGDVPLMSFILVDDGSMPDAIAALSGLDFPVTIAIEGTSPDAAELMQTYRDFGFEVAVTANLPQGALPSDVEVTFQSVFRTLPEAIALLDVGPSGLRSDPALTEQAIGILASQGRGFITANEGLNPAQRAATEAGVPAALITRDLDGSDQDSRVIRRFIEGAAFTARQESGVVLVGRARPDTIAALISWSTSLRDDLVAVVPISKLLLDQ